MNKMTSAFCFGLTHKHEIRLETPGIDIPSNPSCLHTTYKLQFLPACPRKAGLGFTFCRRRCHCCCRDLSKIYFYAVSSS